MNAEKAKGVALLLVSASGMIWTVEELHDKSRFGKQAGDRSIPMETCEPEEQDFVALLRLLDEEVGIGVTIEQPFGFKFLSEVDICGEADVRVYVARFVSAENMEVPVAFRDEIRAVGWLAPEEILMCRCRAGVHAILEMYRESMELA